MADSNPNSADDLQGAGIQAPSPTLNANSLLSALSQGPLQQAQGNPWMQAAAGLAGYGAGVMGQQNPVLQQLQSQQALDLHQKMAAWSIMNSVQQQQAERDKTVLGIAKDILHSPTAGTEAKRSAATLVQSSLTKMGSPTPPGFVESLSAPGAPSLDQRKQAYMAIWAGASDDYLNKNLNIGAEHIPVLRSETQAGPGGDAAYKLMYGKTRVQEDREQAKADLDVRKADAKEAKDAADQIDRHLREARLERQGDERTAAILGQLSVANRRADIAQQMADLAQKKFDYQSTQGPEEKRLKALDHADWVANQLEATSRNLETKGYIPPAGGNVLQVAGVKAKRLAFPNDPDWQFWTKHLQGELVGYARSVQNDIGPRAMAAFQGAQMMAENPPDQASIQKVVDGMRQAIRLSREGKDTAQFVFIKHPNGTVGKVPWKRGMAYDPGDQIVGTE